MPLSLILNRRFEDDDEEYTDSEGNQQFGDGIIDLVNTATEYENQICLDGGIASSKYGIEETLGGQNTTLFQAGDQIYDGNANSLVATIQSAGALGDGDTHTSTASLIVEYINSNTFTSDEGIQGQTSNMTATSSGIVEGPLIGSNEDLHTLTIKDIVSPNSTTYLWTVGETIQGNTSGATAKIYSIEYTTAVRNEDE